MLEEFSEDGVFWRPEDSATKLPGRLTFSQANGARLELLGGFEDIPMALAALSGEGDQNEPVLCGLCGGKYLTLINCISTGGSFTAPGISRSSYRAEVFYRGEAFEAPDEALFNRIEIRLTHLDWWVGLRDAIVCNLSEDFTRVGLEYRQVDPAQICDAEGLSVHIDMRNRIANLGPWHGGPLTLEPYSVLRVEADPPRGYFDILNVIRGVQTLLTLALDTPLIIRSARGIQEQASDSVVTEDEQRTSVDVLYQLPYPNTLELAKREPKHNAPLFALSEIEPYATDVFAAWQRTIQEMRAAHDLLLATVYESDTMFLEQRFLTLAQGLETAHRTLYPGGEKSEEDHNTRLDAILEVVPKDYTKWLRRKLRYSNELSFARRIRELVEAMPVVADAIDNAEHWSQRVAHTRNYLTHHDEALLDRAVPAGEALHWMTELMRMLLEALFLQQLPFDDDLSAKISERLQDREGFALEAARRTFAEVT